MYEFAGDTTQPVTVGFKIIPCVSLFWEQWAPRAFSSLGRSQRLPRGHGDDQGPRILLKPRLRMSTHRIGTTFHWSKQVLWCSSYYCYITNYPKTQWHKTAILLCSPIPQVRNSVITVCLCSRMFEVSAGNTQEAVARIFWRCFHSGG